MNRSSNFSSGRFTTNSNLDADYFDKLGRHLRIFNVHLKGSKFYDSAPTQNKDH